MNELINSEFIRTLIAVLIGGVISFLSVFSIDIRNRRKELKEKKRLIYKGLISNINLLRRYEQNLAQNDLYFNYHRRLTELDKNDLLAKEQAVYHQNRRDESQLKIVEKSETIDCFAIDYGIYFGESKKFDKLIKEINFWKRPEIPNFREAQNLTVLNIELEKHFKIIKQDIQKHMISAVGNLAEYVKTELK